MAASLRAGFGSLARNGGLVALVLVSNLAFAFVLAVPFSVRLEGDPAHHGAARGTVCGFDCDWFPGAGFAFRDQELDPTILGLGALYLLLQAFLAGGLIGVFRAPRGGWTLRGLVHGCGFYFGRMLRVSLLALAAAAAVLAANRPFGRWLDGLAAEAVSGTAAAALGLGRHGLLLLALVLVHMVSSHAKVLVVRAERLSALLALLSSLGFCARNLSAAAGQYLAVGAALVALLAASTAIDARLVDFGWRSPLLALALFHLLVAARIALRLGLLASQVELQNERGR
jgi:hypothetical protein